MLLVYNLFFVKLLDGDITNYYTYNTIQLKKQLSILTTHLPPQYKCLFYSHTKVSS